MMFIFIVLIWTAIISAFIYLFDKLVFLRFRVRSGWVFAVNLLGLTLLSPGAVLLWSAYERFSKVVLHDAQTNWGYGAWVPALFGLIVLVISNLVAALILSSMYVEEKSELTHS